MTTGTLTINLDAIADNWRALNGLSRAETGAVVKGDAYGLGIQPVAQTLARAGARRFFVAVAEEGESLREALGPEAEIFVMSGHCPGDTQQIAGLGLIPMINSIEQMTLHLESLPGHPFGVQLDSGMNRLGMMEKEWAAAAPIILDQNPVLLMSHLACADDPECAMNSYQLDEFLRLTHGTNLPRSLAATGGILLGKQYHMELTRPGIGLYGGLPFDRAKPVATLDLPVIQIRDLRPGETVGYGNSWTARAPCRIATLSGGYADGILRALSNSATLWHGTTRCPLVGRVSMDLLTVDISDVEGNPESLQLLGDRQTVDQLAEAAGTIGYEILTALGGRYARRMVSS